MAKAPSTSSGSSDDPAWMRDPQNPTEPDSDVTDSDQRSRDAEAARQAAAERTGTEQAGTTQQ